MLVACLLCVVCLYWFVLIDFDAGCGGGGVVGPTCFDFVGLLF